MPYLYIWVYLVTLHTDSASKHSLQGYFDALRNEVSPHGISVTVVSPGYIQTNLSRNALQGDGTSHGGVSVCVSALTCASTYVIWSVQSYSTWYCVIWPIRPYSTWYCVICPIRPYSTWCCVICPVTIIPLLGWKSCVWDLCHLGGLATRLYSVCVTNCCEIQ